MSCGNFERIGIRHRKTQTLYLSPLIDVSNIKNPAYGKLQLGVYISAIQEAIDRCTQYHESEASAAENAPAPSASAPGSPVKRSLADEALQGQKKRRKIDPPPRPETEHTWDVRILQHYPTTVN